MSQRRVGITGYGVVSAIGSDRQSFWDALRGGRHGFTPIEGIAEGQLQFRLGAQVALPEDAFPKRKRELIDRFAQLLLLAARQALPHAGLEAGSSELEQSALVTATSLAGQSTQDELFESLYRHGRRRLTPFAVPKIMANAGASQIAIEAGVRGPTFTISTACSSSNHALGIAYWMLRQGAAERAIVGGSDSPFSLGHLKAWDSLRVVSQEPCRPFSKGRNGLILGEGAGVLVLETLDAARERGAKVYAEISGFGMSGDAVHLTRPAVDGAARAIAVALEDSGLAPEEIDHVNAHGTGTLANDRTESEALSRVFGKHRPWVSSTKSMHGHTLGAAGALEAVATVLSLQNQTVPPTAGFLSTDEDCDVRLVTETARKTPIRHAISSSFAFGGLNAVLVFSRHET